MSEEDIPSGNGIYIGPKAKGVTIISPKSYGNKRSGIHIHEDSDTTVVNAETYENGLDGITVSGGKEYNLNDLLSELLERVNELQLSSESERELQSDVSTIKAQLSSPKPKTGIISESLTSLRNIVEGAAGSAVFQGIVTGINAFL